MRIFRNETISVNIPLHKGKTWANNPDIGIRTSAVAAVRSLRIKKQKLLERRICRYLTWAVEVSTRNRTADGVLPDRELFSALQGNLPIPAVKPCSLWNKSMKQQFAESFCKLLPCVPAWCPSQLTCYTCLYKPILGASSRTNGSRCRKNTTKLLYVPYHLVRNADMLSPVVLLNVRIL